MTDEDKNSPNVGRVINQFLMTKLSSKIHASDCFRVRIILKFQLRLEEAYGLYSVTCIDREGLLCRTFLLEDHQVLRFNSALQRWLHLSNNRMASVHFYLLFSMTRLCHQH